jgi:predicted permease
LTTAAIGTLAATICVTTLTFSVVYGITLRQPPYPAADRLLDLRHEGRDERGRRGHVSFPLDALGDLPESFIGLAQFDESQVSIGDGEMNRMVIGTEITPGLMELLGVEPALGRVFNEEDAIPGASAAVILGHELWRTDFAADPQVLGRTLAVNNVPRIIIGVMPEGFAFSYYARLWLPRGKEREVFGYTIDHGIIGRIREGVTIEQASEELEIRRQQLAAANIRPFDAETTGADSGMRFRLEARPLGWERWHELGWLPFTAMVPVGLVLLAACATVAGLLLARAVRRRHEMTLRTVIGGSRARLMRQLMTESALLSAAAGGLGLLGATWSGSVLKGLVDHAFDEAFPYGYGNMGLRAVVPGWLRLEPDAQVVAIVVALGCLVAATIGLVPARQSLQPDLGAALRAGGYGATAGRRSRRWQAALTAAQIALSVALVGTASLTLRGTLALASFDTGIDAERVLELQFGTSSVARTDDRPLARLNLDAIQRYASLPAVESVSSVWEAPTEAVIRRTNLVGNSFSGVATPPPLAAQRSVLGRVVGPDYFRTLGLRVLRGRGIDGRDTATSQRVAVISESVAEIGWPEGGALGQEVILVDGGPAYAVIGIVEDQRRSESLRIPRIDDAWRNVYVPASQIGTVPRYLLVRAEGEPKEMVEPLRRIAHEIDPTIPLTIRRPNAWADENAMLPVFRWLTRALAGIGIGALALAAVGVFSVAGFSVAQRTRELGLRTALGATRPRIMRLVLRDGVRLALIGVLLGTIGAAALGTVVASIFFAVSPFDLPTLAAAALGVVIVTLLAGWYPARRAAAIDPGVALRED